MMEANQRHARRIHSREAIAAWARMGFAFSGRFESMDKPRGLAQRRAANCSPDALGSARQMPQQIRGGQWPFHDCATCGPPEVRALTSLFTCNSSALN